MSNSKMVAGGITHLRENYSNVLETASQQYHKSDYQEVAPWLHSVSFTWGTTFMTLLTHMDDQWDLEYLRDSWIGIVAAALKAEDLVDPESRKLPDELIKQKLDK